MDTFIVVRFTLVADAFEVEAPTPKDAAQKVPFDVDNEKAMPLTRLVFEPQIRKDIQTILKPGVKATDDKIASIVLLSLADNHSEFTKIISALERTDAKMGPGNLTVS